MINKNYNLLTSFALSPNINAMLFIAQENIKKKMIKCFCDKKLAFSFTFKFIQGSLFHYQLKSFVFFLIVVENNNNTDRLNLMGRPLMTSTLTVKLKKTLR
jgi:hypothetical protein